MRLRIWGLTRKLLAVFAIVFWIGLASCGGGSEGSPAQGSGGTNTGTASGSGV